MSNEKDVSQDSSPVTDADLDEALQEVGVEVSDKDKPKTKEELKKGTTDQEDRSQLGRKVKRLEDTFTQILDRLDSLSTYRRPEASSTSQDEELPEYVSTPQDVIRVQKYQKKKEEEEQVRYSDNYLKHFRSLQSRDPELYDEISDEMYSNFNRRLSDDPRYDAMLNYAEAKAAVLAKKFAPVTPNVRGKKLEVPTNVSVESRDTSIPSEEIKLDPLAQSFVDSVGMKDESIREAVKK